MKNKVKNRIIQEDEIDLMALIATLKNGRKTIFKITIVFMVLGLFFAVFSQKEYMASTSFVPQTNDSKVGGGLGGLAAMAGINLGGMTTNSEITPALYPQIINSKPFQKQLLQTILTIEGQPQKISFEDYYTNIYQPGILGLMKKYIVGLPGLIISVFKDDSNNELPTKENGNILVVTRDQDKLIRLLSQKISLSVNDEDGYVMITAKMPEARAAAELAYKVEELLQQYIIDFKIKKSNEQLKFIKERYTEVEKKFKEIQLKIADFEDKNKFATNAKSKIEAQSMKDEYTLVYGVFNELAKQLEAQYIKVTEDTPVFTILEPVVVPLEKSNMKKRTILLIWVFVGFVLGIGFVIVKEITEGMRIPKAEL